MRHSFHSEVLPVLLVCSLVLIEVYPRTIGPNDTKLRTHNVHLLVENGGADGRSSHGFVDVFEVFTFGNLFDRPHAKPSVEQRVSVYHGVFFYHFT